jgi:hypothetical protein
MEQLPQSKSSRKRLRSLTRLVIGGVMVGLDSLLTNLDAWERQLEEQESQKIVAVDAPQAAGEEQTPRLEHALVGLVFEAQDTLLAGMEKADRLSQAVIRLNSFWLKPLQRSWPVRTLAHQMDRLTERGETEVKRWAERGRVEVEQSRRLAETAVSETVESGIESLTTNPEVRDLVQTQSTGLANEVLEEIRERTVSADNFLEGIARRVLKRTPRPELPEPSEQVLERATSARAPQPKRESRS